MHVYIIATITNLSFMSTILCRVGISEAFHHTDRSSKQFLSFDSEKHSCTRLPRIAIPQPLSHLLFHCYNIQPLYTNRYKPASWNVCGEHRYFVLNYDLVCTYVEMRRVVLFGAVFICIL
jgi:hypothetical protein